MIRHFVHLRFRPDVTNTDKNALYEALAGLSDHIDGIFDFQHRQNVSPETPVVRGFHDMFWFDFRDADVRDTYLDHPAHKAVGARLVDHLDGGIDGVFVCDIDLSERTT